MVVEKRYWRKTDARAVLEAWQGSGQPLSSSHTHAGGIKVSAPWEGPLDQKVP